MTALATRIVDGFMVLFLLALAASIWAGIAGGRRR